VAVFLTVDLQPLRLAVPASGELHVRVINPVYFMRKCPNESTDHEPE
jgi:hypothetical protein